MMSLLKHSENRLRFRDEPASPPAVPKKTRRASPAPIPGRQPHRHLEPVIVDATGAVARVAEFLATVAAVGLVIAAIAVWRKGRAALIAFAERPADPLIAGLARILFATLGIWNAATLTGFIELNWYSQPAAVRTYVLYGHWFWIGTLVLLLCGWGGRLVAFLHLAIAVAIFNADDLGSTVSSDLYLVGSFWLSFTRLDGRLRLRLPRPVERLLRFDTSAGQALPKAWPLVLLGFNDGVLLLTSGISKFFDPFWIRGIGFYETFALPWIKDPAAAGLLNSQFLMMALNYGGMALEILFLPLFFLKRTRPIACGMLIAFFMLLTYPLRIDFIGPLGIVHGIALVAATPTLARWLNKLARRLGLGVRRRADFDEWITDDDPVRERARRKLGYCAVFGFVVYVAFWGTYSTALVRFNPWFDYPLTRAKSVAEMQPGERLPEVTGPSSWLEPIRRRLLYFCEDHVTGTNAFVPVDLVNRLATRMGPKVLFCATHFIGIYEYRVTVTLADGRELEPVRVFNPDKTAGPYSESVGCPRCLQRLMYDVTSICQDRLANPKASPDQECATLERLVHFSLTKLPPQERDQAVRADVLVSPIVVPLAFEGDSRPWLDYRWTRLYERDLPRATAHFCEPPALYPDQLVVYRAR
jgi:hypothetical protein